jgi:uncharacterized membrane protein
MASTFHVYFGLEALDTRIRLRMIEPRDCIAALREGFDDFLAMPTHGVFVAIFYAIAGIVLVGLTSFSNALHLVFPFAAGFALVGPFVAIGLYEMSRRREKGLRASWRDAFAVARSPALPSILALGLLLFFIFAVWIAAADLLYVWLYGPKPPAAALPFLGEVLTTGRGWALILIGGVIGFGFAALTLCLSVVSFPLMLDRDVGVVPAVVASLRTARHNPRAVAAWGLIVAAALILGSLPLFIGLAIVMPVLGHATWRLYRRAIERDPVHEVPIESPASAEEVTKNPVLRFVLIFVDLFQFLRRRKEWSPDASNREAKAGAAKEQADES